MECCRFGETQLADGNGPLIFRFQKWLDEDSKLYEDNLRQKIWS